MFHSALSFQEKVKSSPGASKGNNWLLPALGIAAAIGGSVYSARAARKEAEKNRAFQAEMSNTAHQREVADLMAAGLNPLLSANRGASSPGGSMADLPDFGDSAARGIGSALALRQMKANIGLTEAQALNAAASAEYTRVQSGEFREGTQNRLRRLYSEADLAELTAQERRQLLPFAVDKAKAEIESLGSAAGAARARAVLDKLAVNGAVNESEFQAFIGQAGPWGKVVAGIAKLGIAGAAAGAVIKGAGKRFPRRKP